MILQALTDYYGVLVERGEIAKPGWSKIKVSFAICLNPDGSLERIMDIRTEQTAGKKTVLLPQEIDLPAQCKRSSGVAANYLCDNSGYMLGIDAKGNPGRTKECFEACKSFHEKILENAKGTVANAILAFFRCWDFQNAAENPLLKDYITDILVGGNLIFRVNGEYVHNDPEIRYAWDRYYSKNDDDTEEAVCLVTGEKSAIAKLHPVIKNVAGAQSSGASLVSFNAPAFCSYGKDQSFNAPTSQYAAFAYAAALNHLLADRDRVFRVGDTTVVCWAKGGKTAYQNLFSFSFMGNEMPKYSNEDLRKAVKSLCNGEMISFDEERLDPSMEFYVLGLSPNAARLSVRFFLRNSFGEFLRNLQAHNERLEIIKPSFDTFEQLPLWKLTHETVNQKSRDKAPVPGMSGELMRSVLTNTPYPATLLNGVMLRITAEQEINRTRAAIIKAYYLKNKNPQVPKEVLTVSLNADSTNIPYNLGRLFSVLENIQEAANPGLNTTLKDKYFNSASATPSRIFPVLIDLAQKHLRKIDGGLKVHYNKQLQELLDKIGEEFPANMSLPMKGSFQLGYYHQTQKRYEKKEDK